MEDEIINCPIKFEFKCPKLWDSLESTEERDIKFCGECSQKVYYCTQLEELEYRSKLGDCVAFRHEAAKPVYDLLVGKLEEPKEDYTKFILTIFSLIILINILLFFLIN